MRISRWAGLFLAVLPFLAGCGDFWQAPSGTSTNTSFSLSSGGNITVSPGATTGNTSVITVTPANSFTGTVDLTCSVTAPTNSTNPATCSLSPTSVDISSTSVETATLTATTAAATSAGAYTITVSGSSGGLLASTSVCALVGSSSSSCTNTASTSGVFYVLGASSIAGYTINSGVLTAVSGNSNTLSGANAIAIAPNGSFLYVASVSGGITLYTIDSSTGALTQGSTIIADSAVEAMQIDPSGLWLLDASLSSPQSSTLTAYPITSAGARDTTRTAQPSIQLAGAAVQQMAVSPNGALIAIALGASGTESFSFDASNNTTPIGSEISVVNPYGGVNGGSAISVAIDPQSRLLYIGELAAFNSNTNSGALRVFTIGANDLLTELSYSANANLPYAPLGTGPHAILPDPTGSYVYAASWQTGGAGSITGYSVATTALTQIGSSTVATGTGPIGLAEDSTGSFVLAVDGQGSPSFNAYTFDATTTGLLDAATVSGSPAAAPPIAIAALPKQ